MCYLLCGKFGAERVDASAAVRGLRRKSRLVVADDGGVDGADMVLELGADALEFRVLAYNKSLVVLLPVGEMGAKLTELACDKLLLLRVPIADVGISALSELDTLSEFLLFLGNELLVVSGLGGDLGAQLVEFRRGAPLLVDKARLLADSIGINAAPLEIGLVLVGTYGNI